MTIVKAHAFGNDFLLVPEDEAGPAEERASLARRLCDRHTGAGADGLIVYAGRRMKLFNADGSYSEVSGNGVRCLAAWLAGPCAAGHAIEIETDAGLKTLTLLSRDGRRATFRAAMGAAEQVARVTLEVAGRPLDVITLRIGNPQCIVFGPATEERLMNIAAPLAVHPAFPHGANVELVEVERPDRLRILIWERGVGPTQASGTGACASAVAATRFAQAERSLTVASPGGEQRVEIEGDDIYLTGWAEVVYTATLF